MYFVFEKICGSGLNVVLVPRFGDRRQRGELFGLGDAPFVFLLPDVAVAGDFDLAPFGEEVDHRDADAVQTARSLVGPFFEFAAELEDGHHAFKRGHIPARLFGELGMPLDRNAAAIVFDRDAAINVDRNAHRRGVVGHRFVDRVVPTTSRQ